MEILIIINYKKVAEFDIKIKYIVGSVIIIILVILIYKSSSLLLAKPITENDVNNGINYIVNEVDRLFEIKHSFDVDNSMKLFQDLDTFAKETSKGTKDYIDIIIKALTPKVNSDIQAEKEFLENFNDNIVKTIKMLKELR